MFASSPSLPPTCTIQMQHPHSLRLPHLSLLLQPCCLLAGKGGSVISCLGDRRSLPAGLLASSLSLPPSILFAPPDSSSLNTAHCLSLPSLHRLPAPHGHRLLQQASHRPPAISRPVPLYLLLPLSGHHKLRFWLMSLSEAPGHQVVCSFPAPLALRYDSDATTSLLCNPRGQT